MFLTVQDFTGKYQLSTGMYDVTKLQDYIDKYEKRYLIELFGAKLYDEFISDLDVANVPESPNFLKVFDPFYENVTLRQLIISEGILEMLKGFVYFEYSKDLINQMTPYGNVRPISENSEPVSTLYSMIYARYNEAIKSYKAIQLYIQINMNAPTGQALSVTIITAGTGYLDALDIPTTGLFGKGLTLDIITDGSAILSATINQSGSGYKISEDVNVFNINTGQIGNAIFRVIGIGKGDFSTFNGQQKQTSYWI
jgi:hypothetical protein